MLAAEPPAENRLVETYTTFKNILGESICALTLDIVVYILEFGFHGLDIVERDGMWKKSLESLPKAVEVIGEMILGNTPFFELGIDCRACILRVKLAYEDVLYMMSNP